MNRKIALVAGVMILWLILTVAGCGKKAPPVLPQKAFDLRVSDLEAEWEKGYFKVKGKIPASLTPERAGDLILGCRVYYAQYPLEEQPCAGCPIKYQGYHGFGPEVIAEEGFSCRVPGKERGQVYFLRVHLIGKEKTLGPPSNRVEVRVE